MTKAFRKNIFRTIQKSMGRYMAIFAIIALGVGFFSGLKASKPNMIRTAQDYIIAHQMFDFRLLSTWGFDQSEIEELGKIDGVAYAEGALMLDVLYLDEGNEETVLKAMSITENINKQDLVAGRLPTAGNECVLDDAFFGEDMIGKDIKISPNNETDTLDSFAYDSYRVTGLVKSVLYINRTRGTTNIGDGRVFAFFCIPNEGFTYDYYTQAYLYLEGDDAAFTDAYNDEIKGKSDTIEDRATAIIEERYHKEVKDARAKIDDAKQELADGKQELADGKQELADAKQELADKVAEAQAELADALEQLNDGGRLLEEGRQELADGWATWSEKNQELADGAVALQEGINQYNSGMAQYTDGRAQFEAGLAQYNEGYAQFQTGLAQYNDGYAQYTAGLEQYDAGLAQYQIQRAEFEAQKAAYEASVAAGLPRDPATEAQLAAAQQQLDAAAATLAQTKAQLDATAALLAQTKAQLDATTEVFAQSKAQLDTTAITLDEGKAQLDSAYAQIQSSSQQITDGQRQLSEARQQLVDAQAEIDKNAADLAQGRIEYNDGVAELAQQTVDAEREIADAEAEIASHEQDIADGEKEIADAEQELDDLEEPKVYTLDRSTNVGYASYESDIGIVESVSAVFPVFFVLIAALVCSTTMTRMVDEEHTQIGTFRSQGYGELTVLSKYLIYSASAAILGGVFGFFVGIRAFPWTIWLAYSALYGFADLVFLTDYSMLTLSLVVAVICSAGTAFLACRIELSHVPAQLIRPKAPPVGKRIFLERIPFIWKHMKFLYKVSARNIFRFKKRMFMMIIGISGCSALVLAGLGLRDSIADVVHYQYGTILTYDISATYTRALAEDTRQEIQSTFGDEIKNMAVLMQTGADVPVTAGGSKSATLWVDQNGELENSVNLHWNGKPVGSPGKGEVVIDDRLARVGGWEIGDEITVQVGDATTQPLKISGIFENYVQYFAYVSAETYEAYFDGEYEENTVFLTLNEGADEYQIASWLGNLSNVSSISVVSELRGQIDQMMASLNYVVLLVIGSAAALAFVVLFNLGNINISERIREIATLKVLGFYSGETASYVFRENMVLCLIGIAVGLPLGIILHRFIISQIQIDMISFQIIIKPVSFGLAVLLVIGFSVAVDLMLRRKIEKIDMAESLKSIE